MTALAGRIRADLRAAADPERASAMAAYMKSAETGNLPFLGVRRPDLRRLVKAAVRDHPGGVDVLTAVVRELWDEAAFREERYAAQDLVGLRWAHGRLELLDLYREMAVTGAWWDHVDEVAHRIGDLTISHPAVLDPVLRAWSTDPSRWLRRLAILGQQRRRDAVDLDLLAVVIEPNLADPDFFVRKAIGWALRDVARHHPDWVRTFVDTHDLSPLSRREALKHLEASGCRKGAMTDRKATTVWSGTLFEGSGDTTFDSSGIGTYPVSWASRAEEANGKTSPEELIAGAHSACFSMAFSNMLAKNETPADRLEVSAVVTFVPGTGITTSALTVVGTIPGIDEAKFQELAADAKANCPVSQALSVEITLDATLA